MNITTLAAPWQRLFATNQTGSSITAPVETATKPSGDGIIPVLSSAGSFNQLLLLLFGVGSAAQTGIGRVTAFSSVVESGATVWVPTPLYAFTWALGTATRLSNELWADTIAEGTAYTSAVELLSGADNLQAALKLDVAGAELVQIQLAVTNATSINGLWRPF